MFEILQNNRNKVINHKCQLSLTFTVRKASGILSYGMVHFQARSLADHRLCISRENHNCVENSQVGIMDKIVPSS